MHRGRARPAAVSPVGPHARRPDATEPPTACSHVVASRSGGRPRHSTRRSTCYTGPATHGSLNGRRTPLANRQTEGLVRVGRDPRRGPVHPYLDRVLGETAARPHLRGEGGPGRSGGTGPRGAGHRRRETPVPTSGEEVGGKAHHYDKTIGACVETVTGHGHLFPTCIVRPLFTHAKSPRRVKAEGIGNHRAINGPS